MDRGEGPAAGTRAPGNLYSAPQQARHRSRQGRRRPHRPRQGDPAHRRRPRTRNTSRHERIQSERLTKFWGRPMHLGACTCCCPRASTSIPRRAIRWSSTTATSRTRSTASAKTPPDPDLKPDYSERFRLAGYNRIQQEYAYAVLQGMDRARTSRGSSSSRSSTPIPTTTIPTPSIRPTSGPTATPSSSELIPYIEKKYRGLGQGWARFLYGGSTGGWEALARPGLLSRRVQRLLRRLSRPDRLPRLHDRQHLRAPERLLRRRPVEEDARGPGLRNYLGEVSATLEEANHRELALGTHGRSGGQWDIWQAVFGPVGADGYPKPIWDKLHRRDRPRRSPTTGRRTTTSSTSCGATGRRSGPSSQGKIHIYVGDMDNYYLNNAVYLAEAFLEGTKDPYYGGEVDYGDRAEHCWNGDHDAAERHLAPALSPDVRAADRRADPGHGPEGRGRSRAGAGSDGLESLIQLAFRKSERSPICSGSDPLPAGEAEAPNITPE
ncbi:MAG: hypothetical protein MZU95_01380 [Desulfomicrobium escambiense]|nr:hypothetical protein [Desulfomicrobium escambiense]